MKRFLTGALLTILMTSIEAGEASRAKYEELIARYPSLVQPRGSIEKGEIEIVLDRQRMEDIEKSLGRDVGVIAQDKYWIWINDACLFPSGQKGIYGRILWMRGLESPPGVAVMPILPDGTIVLNCNFRHATRSWEAELPRGCLNLGETVEEAAKREAAEETGMVIDHLFLLGQIPPDSGLTGTLVPIFAAKVIRKEQTRHDDSEAIEGILALSLKEIRKAFVDGYYECHIRGEKQRIFFRDPFLAYALLIYELKQTTMNSCGLAGEQKLEQQASTQ